MWASPVARGWICLPCQTADSKKKNMAGSLSLKGMLPICQSSSKAEKMWFSHQKWWLSIKKWWFSIRNGHIDLGLGRPEGFRWRRPPARKGHGCPGHGMSWWSQVEKAMVRRGQGTTLFWDLWNLWNLYGKITFCRSDHRSVFCSPPLGVMLVILALAPVSLQLRD